MDYQTSTPTVTGETQDTRWRSSTHGEDAGRSGQLDPSTLVAGTHYKAGAAGDNGVNVVPSGLPLGLITATKFYGPFDPDATDGRDTLAGYLLRNAGVSLGADPANAKPTIAVLVHGGIAARYLPVTPEIQAAVKTAETTGIFFYTED